MRNKMTNDAYLADLETRLSEAYILNDNTLANYLEKLIAEFLEINEEYYA
jgi:hypothetical protein